MPRYRGGRALKNSSQHRIRRRFEFASAGQRDGFQYGPAPLLLSGGFTAGKLLTLDTPLPTPDGWKLMRDVRDGDVLFDEQGRPTTVVKAHAVEIPERLFRVHFTGGTSIDAGGEHLWTAWAHRDRKALHRADEGFPLDWPKWRSGGGAGPRVYSTQEMFEGQRIKRASSAPETCNFAIPNAACLDLPTVPLPLDPYVLGVWLGDGSSNSGAVTSADSMSEVRRRGFPTWIVPSTVREGNNSVLHRVDGLTTILAQMGVLNGKHVPPAYLRASRAQRLDLLRGLMDTDGTAGQRGDCTFTSTNLQLAQATHELLLSLGVNASITEGRATISGRDCGPVWDVYFRPTIQPFLLPRKATRATAARFNHARARFKYITHIEEIEPRPARCLTVDSPNSLYLAGRGMVPTHNTLCASRKILYISDLFPGNRGVVVRRVWDRLKKTTMATFFKDCPPEAYNRGGRRSDNDKILQFNPRLCEDGITRQSEILWLYLDNPESEEILRGLEINWFFIDQAEEVEEEHFDILLRRLGRWDRAFVPPQVMLQEQAAGRPWRWWSKDGKPIPPTYPILTANPDTELHWLYRRFHPDSEEWQHHYRALGYKMIELSPLDNRFLTDQNKEMLLTADESWKRRFVYGKWGMPEGLIHTVHPDSVVDGTPEIYEWLKATATTFYRILDHGDSAPTAVGWMAVLPGGECVFYREYYRPNDIISNHRQRIFDLSEKDGHDIVRRYNNLADPSIFFKTAQRQGGKYSVSDEYTETSILDKRTAIWWRPADNNELGTRNRINEYLRIDPNRTNPFTRAKGSPALFFLRATPEYPDGCRKIIQETRQQRREKKGSMDGHPVFTDDRDETIPDHGYDLVRYGIAARPPILQRVVVDVEPEFTLDKIYRQAAARPANGLYVPVPLSPVRR